MAFWAKNSASEKSSADHSLSIIGEGVRLEGTLEVPGNLRIEGTFRGRVTVGNRLVIAESGQVYGHIQARELLIAGTFEGEIRDSQHVEITGTACVKGSMHSQKLEVHAGAILQLSCQVGDVSQIPSAPSANGLTAGSDAASPPPERTPASARPKGK